ncbi:MAG: phospho-sugar mutase [Clostridia bacterium]|nr:phospho-sugar mutase [Clostridia bacterium]
MENYLEKYQNWLESSIFDESTKAELQSIKENEKEIEDRFYKDLAFGTGGLRGVIGSGTNRMNIYTVRKATQGLANYIIKKKAQDRGVAIAYDSRNMSIEFSEEVALCLNANGIKTYRFESLRPTPELSFSVRELGCIAGVVITASHNPPEYNGYKVYWEDGGQIVAPYDKEIITEVNNITNYDDVKTISKEDAISLGLYNVIGKEIDDRYIEELKKLILNPDVIKEMSKDIKIVYTPLHGTGNIPVQRILKELGFEKVYVVPEQEKPDGNFPTVNYPNPEDKKAFALALELAKKVDADIVLATDPDADRLGVYSKDSKTGEYKSFTGNMSGLLIAEYELSQKREKGILPKNGALVKTIVSSNMANEIVKEYDIKLVEVLTGFKYIGEQIKLFEEKNNYEYLFGYEESYGCLIGTYARDKDAVSAVMALCEAAAFYKKQGITLWEQMLNIYNKYGYYKEGLASITLKGADGASKIREIMAKLRNEKIEIIANNKVIALRDYENRIRTEIENENVSDLSLPKSNVLYYELENDSWVCVRPSGTEPKIKFYMGVVGNNLEDSEEKLEKLREALLNLVK